MASSRNNRKRSKNEKKKSHTKEDKIIADAKSALESSSDSEDNDEELFSVEKIVDSKIDKNGVQLYKCRWKGYTAAHDTWEPTENVSSTGVSVIIIYCVIISMLMYPTSIAKYLYDIIYFSLIVMCTLFCICI